MIMKNFRQGYYFLSGCRMKIFYSLLILLLSAVFSCSGGIPNPSKEQINRASQQWEGTSEESLLMGKKLYINKCSGCHSLRIPSNYSLAQWDTIMQKMGPAAKLSLDEYQNIFKYITTVIN